MAWEAIGSGVLATALAWLQVFAWAALGSVLVAREPEPRIALPVAILAGITFTGFAHALFAWAGWAHAGMLVVATACAIAILLRGRATAGHFRYLLERYRQLCGGQRWVIGAVVAWMLLYWALSLPPPRDADVLRYHLAHIRLIDLEGSWEPLLHINHALPFGWSINYLPFEYLGLPEGAHQLNLALLVIAVGLVFDVMRQFGAGRGIAAALCGVFAFQPWVLKSATTAYVDMHVHFAMVAVVALLAELPKPDVRRLALLGFVAWTGTQARYQAVIIGLTVSLLVLWLAVRRRLDRRTLSAFGLGAIGAGLLSAPYYVRNLFVFENPVWPLLIKTINGLEVYADRAADAYMSAQHGSYAPGALLGAAWHFLLNPEGQPVPILAFGLLGVALFMRLSPVVRSLVFLVAAYLVIWALAQPVLYARYGTYLTVWVVAAWAPILTQWSQIRLLRHGIRAALATALAGALGLAAWYSYDGLRYVATGNLAAYHTFTPFWEAHQWINRVTPTESRHLIVVSSSYSYHIDRVVRQADPSLSGEVDWLAVASAEDLDRVFAEREFDYLVYEDRDWSPDVGGAQMMGVIDAAVAEGLLRPIARFDTRIYWSRIKRIWVPTVLYVLERTRGPLAGRVQGDAVAWGPAAGAGG